MDNSQIEFVLQEFGKRVPAGSQIYLLGGSALVLLGSPRPTIDIDFVGDDISPSQFDQAIIEAAKELKIYAEPVPLGKFIPIPSDSHKRKISIGKYGNLEVFVVDPYSIALSKLDRGFDTDVDDILFLIQNGYVEFKVLERMTRTVLTHTREFDINATDFTAHLEIVRERLR